MFWRVEKLEHEMYPHRFQNSIEALIGGRVDYNNGTRRKGKFTVLNWWSVVGGV